METISLHWLVTVSIFASVFLFTPGPNNIMLTNSGASYGYRKTLPHILGVALGAPFILFAVALGGYHVFHYDLFRYSFQLICIIYLIWLAYKIATAQPNKKQQTTKPFNFFQAALFQWLNPKVWSQYLIALGVYVSFGDAYKLEVITMACIFAILGMVSASIWTLFGNLIAKYLNKPKQFRLFNVTMALLLVLTVLPVLIERLG